MHLNSILKTVATSAAVSIGANLLSHAIERSTGDKLLAHDISTTAFAATTIGIGTFIRHTAPEVSTGLISIGSISGLGYLVTRGMVKQSISEEKFRLLTGGPVIQSNPGTLPSWYDSTGKPVYDNEYDVW